MIATKTLGLHMLGGRGDVAVLWNIRVSPRNGAGVSGPRCSGSSPVPAVAVPQSAGWTGVLARGPRGPGLTACPAGRISPAARARRRPAYGVDASFALFLHGVASTPYKRRDGRERERGRSRGSRRITPEPSGHLPGASHLAGP